jgi:GT2 family glycosyltransferase
MIPGAVTVGFLHPGHYAAVFAESLIDLFFFDASQPEPRIVSHDHGKMAKECGAAGIVTGRNQLAKVLLDDSQSEWLFMVDSDMGFGMDTVERLIASADPVDRPVMGGLAFAHKTDGHGSFRGLRFRCSPTIYDYVDTEDAVGFRIRMEYEREQVVACSGTGGACILIHRSVLQAIRERYGDVWFDQVTHPSGTVFSEDLSFCVRVAGVGKPIHVDTSVKTCHDKGGVFYDEEFFDRQEAARKVTA